MFDTILKIADKLLEYAILEKRDHWRQEYHDLKRGYYEEYNKDISIRSDAILDNIRYRVCILLDSVTASLGKSNTPD